MLGSICAFSKHDRARNGLIDIGIFIGIGTSAAITLGTTLLLAVQIKWNYSKCLKTCLEICLYGIMTVLIAFISLLKDIKYDTDVIAQQIAELEETVKAMRATLFLVCRGRLLEKQIGNVKIYIF